MAIKFKDNSKYYEAYNTDGELVTSGPANQMYKFLGFKKEKDFHARVCHPKYKVGSTIGGLEVIEVGRIRKIFDAYRGSTFVCSGTYDEIAERLGLALNTVRLASYDPPLNATTKCNEKSRALSLFECENPRVVCYY